MKSRPLLLAACLSAAGCNERAPDVAEEDPAQIFARIINEDGSLAFESWNGKKLKEQGWDNDSILHFRKDSRLELEEFGFDVRSFRGSYVLEPGGRITVNLKGYQSKWPAMTIRRDDEGLLLYREDGVTSWPIDSPHPDVSIEGYWPFRESIKAKKQNKPCEATGDNAAS